MRQWATRWLAAALAVPLVVYALIGSYSRYTADDYCWAGILRTEGFLNAQVRWYTQYSPRYAFTLLINLVELAGPAIVPFLPGLALIVWIATLSWTLRQFSVPHAVIVAEVIALATLQTAPDLPQSLYWQTGMLTYVLPLILATFLAGWLRFWSQRRFRWWAAGVCLVVTFLAGGLAETYLIPQNVLLSLALALAVWRAATLSRRGLTQTRKPNMEKSTTSEASSAYEESNATEAASAGEASRADEASRASEVSRASEASRAKEAWTLVAYLGAALAGGVLALIAIVVAPATASRVGGPPANLWLAASAAIATAAYQVWRLGRYFGLAALLCLAVPFLLRRAKAPGPWPRSLLVVTAVVAVTLPFAYFPSFYAQNGNPPARSLIVPGFLLVAYLVYLGLRAPVAIRQVPAVATLLALSLVPLGIAALNWPERAAAAEYAALWDAEDALIRARRDAGELDLTVPQLPPNFGEHFVSADREDWFNECVARYYGLRSIAAG